MTTKKEKLPKSRVTTYLDRDVLMWLKVRALEQRLGYQTLLNRMLRDAIENHRAEEASVRPASRSEVEELALSVKRLERQLRNIRSVAEAKRAASKAAPVKKARGTKNQKRRSR